MPAASFPCWSDLFWEGRQHLGNALQASPDQGVSSLGKGQEILPLFPLLLVQSTQGSKVVRKDSLPE